MTAQPVIIGVNFGPPTTTSQLPVTTQDGGQFLVTALADLATLATAISTALTDVTTADTDMEALVTNLATVVTDANTSSTDATASDNDTATSLADFDLVATTATNGIVALLNTSGGGPLTYNSGTHQYSGACGTSSTISQANGNALITLLNTLGSAIVAAKAATAAGKTAAATCATDATTAQTNGNTTEAAIDVALADVTALSTSTVSTDITNGQAILTSNLIVRTDKSVCATQSVLNAGLVAALALVNANTILPP